MQEFQISHLEEGQRFDKYLSKQLPQASKSFLYKMLRKKNITLNGKKADGSEKIKKNDVVRMFFADETYEKFAAGIKSDTKKADKNSDTKYQKYRVPVLFENQDVIVFDKPSGMLSQKAKPTDYSMVEYLADYLVDTGFLTKDTLQTFHPGICNRLDRNTSGIVVAGKSVKGLQEMSLAFKARSLQKYYLCIVYGRVNQRQNIKGFLKKDAKTNKVKILTNEEPDALPIETEYIPIATNEQLSVLKVHLITGRSHQIRAHLAAIGHPIIGDTKYGKSSVNVFFQKAYHIRNQMLHAYELNIPQAGEVLSEGLHIYTTMPQQFEQVMKGEHLWEPGIQEDFEAQH